MIKKIVFQSFVILTFAIVSCSKNQITTLKLNQGNIILEQKIDSVLALMTLQEKIGQMVQYSGGNIKTGPDSNIG